MKPLEIFRIEEGANTAGRRVGFFKVRRGPASYCFQCEVQASRMTCSDRAAPVDLWIFM